MLHTVDLLEGKNCKIIRKLLNDISEEKYSNAMENRIDNQKHVRKNIEKYSKEGVIKVQV